MKRSELTFAQGFLSTRSQNNNTRMVFDWDKAAIEIAKYINEPNLIAEAGLQGDWNYTGGVIFENGSIINDENTYLLSNWATPTLLISSDNISELEIPCYTTDSDTRFTSGSQWDEQSLLILNDNIDKMRRQ